MASKFKIWVDDDHLNKVQTYDTFVNDTQRTAGFTGGTPASSERVNTALRQANLVACALMELVDSNGTRDFRSTVTQVKNCIGDWLASSAWVYHSDYSDFAVYASKIGSHNGSTPVTPQIGNIEQPTYVDNTGTIKETAYIPKLNGANQQSSTSFYAPTGYGNGGQLLSSTGYGEPQWVEPSGLTVGDATRAVNATNATTADKANKIVFVTTPPTESPEEGTLVIYVSSSIPTTRYDRVLYLMTY